jgi:hypothetical protein
MAARLNPRHQEMVREKIRGSQLVNALQKHALGKLHMKDTQIRAALGLLAKTLPDLQRTELTGRDGGPVEHYAVAVMPRYDDPAAK